VINAYWNLIVFTEQRGDYGSVVKLCRDMWDKLKDQSAKHKVESMINKRLWTEDVGAIQKYKKGLKLKKRNKKDDALILFRESVNTAPDFLAPKFEIAMMAYKKGDTNEAARYLNDIIYRIPFYAEAHLILGDIYYNSGSYMSAIGHFNSALEFGFLSTKTRYILNLKKAKCLYSEGEYEKAKESAEAAIKLRKKATKPLILLSAIHIKQKNYDDALKTLHRANSLSPNNPAILFQIGSIYYKQNNWKHISYFDRLFDIAKNRKNIKAEKYFKAFTILIKSHYEKKNYSRTAEIISHLPESYVNYDITLISAKTSYHQHKYDQAIDKFEKISLNDDDKFMLCQAYARSGRMDQAREIITGLIYYDKYLEMAKKDRYLAKILKDIDFEKTKKEEEEKRLERERLEKEKLERERLEKEKKEMETEENIKIESDRGKTSEDEL